MGKKIRLAVSRGIILIAGLILCALGAVLCTRPDLGTSPIAALPYVVSAITPLSFGSLTFIFNALCLAGQILILKRDFQWIQLTQLAAAFVLSLFIDLFMGLTASSIPQSYPYRLIWSLAGSFITALGIALEIVADLIYLPGDGLISAITKKWPIKFGWVKIGFDLTLVLSAVAIILIASLDFSSIREGTIISAFLVGYCLKLLDRPANRIRKYFIFSK